MLSCALILYSLFMALVVATGPGESSRSTAVSSVRDKASGIQPISRRTSGITIEPVKVKTGFPSIDAIVNADPTGKGKEPKQDSASQPLSFEEAPIAETGMRGQATQQLQFSLETICELVASLKKPVWYAMLSMVFATVAIAPLVTLSLAYHALQKWPTYSGVADLVRVRAASIACLVVGYLSIFSSAWIPSSRAYNPTILVAIPLLIVSVLNQHRNRAELAQKDYGQLQLWSNVMVIISSVYLVIVTIAHVFACYIKCSRRYKWEDDEDW